MTELRDLEELALVVLSIALPVNIIARTLWPQYAVFPEWVVWVLLAIWFVGFFKWAATGGIPPRVRGRS